MTASAAFSYIVPIRLASGDSEPPGLTEYLRKVSEWCDDVIVVDGSPEVVRSVNARRWAGRLRLLTPDPAHACLNGKVAGVLSGIDQARHERIVIADDDVRYDRDALLRTVALLADHDLVRPQNYFSPLPWHAAWDTARSLLNRGTVGVDFPGTLAVRRSVLRTAGGYDGNVLFENLELIRTVRAHGGRIFSPLDLYVRREPPSARRFLSQRTRQAYDDFAIPGRMTVWLGILPALAGLTSRHRTRPWLGAALGAMAIAERGRRRADGDRRFPPVATLLAPVWVLERSCCAWLAVLQRVIIGGTRYGGGVIRVAAHSERALRRAAACP